MMKIKNIFSVLALSFIVVSCSEDTMDRINQDKDHPAAGIVNATLQITDAEVASVFSVACGNYAWNVASYTEQLLGTGNNQLYYVEMRDPIQTAGSTTFDNEWNATYLNLKNITQIIEKCGAGGVNDGNNDLLAMAQTLAAYNWGILTDLHGDIPCSEALTDSVSAPKVDKQEDVYKHIIALLDGAIDNATTAIADGQNNVGKQDFLFNGDMTQWRGLAHALKARYELHLYGRNKTNDQLNLVLSEANDAVTDGFEGAILNFFNGNSPQDNSWTAYFYSREYTGSSKTVDDLMLSRNDPREPIYNTKDGYVISYDNPGMVTDAIGIPGDKDLAQSVDVENIPSWLNNGAAYEHLFSKSELYFILAEVKTRLGQDGYSDFNTAVEASIKDYSDVAYPGSNLTISTDATANYISGLSAYYKADPLGEIMIQKYIAMARDEQLETYNDIRRCEYVDGKYYVTLTNPNNNSSLGNRWPLCLPYGSSDVVSNPNVKAAFGSGNDAGMYVFKKNVWFAGGE